MNLKGSNVYRNKRKHIILSGLNLNMKKSITIFILLFVSKMTIGQNHNYCEPIIISDSLFKAPTMDWYYHVEKVKDNFVRGANCSEDEDINDVFTIDNDCLKFKIGYGCGCGTILTYKLVTSGILQQDNSGNKYYNIKLYFITDNLCKKVCHTDLSYNISQLKNKDSIQYLKFDGCDKLIPYK